MNEDYLWDRSGEADPEVLKLEGLLETLRYSGLPPDFSRVPFAETPRRWHERIRFRTRFHPVYASLAVVLFLSIGAAGLWFLQRGPSWAVATLTGEPKVGSSDIRKAGRLHAGQWLQTDAASRARIRVGEIGEVEVEPNTRLRLVRAGEVEHRLFLERGRIHAFIVAPPRRFFVDTPSARAVDLGCSYELEVAEDGSGRLHVTSGWVAFEQDGRESFVPAQAQCLMRPGVGPGTPFRDDASPAFRKALERFNFDNSGDRARKEALDAVLAEARREDSLTLWHLLSRGNEAELSRVYERLAVLFPPPKGVTRDGVLHHDRDMLDLWWNELGLGETQWWRLWERPLPASR